MFCSPSQLSDHSILNLANYQITKWTKPISALYLGKLTLGWDEAQDEWLLLLWTQDISRTLWIVALFFGRFCCGCWISLITISGVSYPCAMCFCCGRWIFLTLQPASTFEQFYFCIVTLFLFGCLCCGLRISLTLSVLSCPRAEIK